MMNKDINSPFLYGKIVTGLQFIDREHERKVLSSNLKSGINTILISPRRWGKSSLVNKVAAENKIIFCMVDLFAIRTEREFYQALAREVLKKSSSVWKQKLDTFGSFFKRLVPKLSMSMSPDQDVSVSFEWKELQQHAEEVLSLAENIAKAKGVRMVVCLDEFQNIAFFDDPLAFQKRLRSAWQKHQHVTYCLYGSKRHMMIELFEDKSMPFYKFGQVMFLNKIPVSYWVKHITGGFTQMKKKISEGQASSIAQLMEEHPYFVQQLAQTVLRNTSKDCSDKIIKDSIEELFTQHGILFQKEVDNLTNPQVNLLKAICMGEAHMSSAEVMNEYQLGTSATVKRSREALEKKEIIDVAGNKLEVQDPLFKLWFMKYFIKK